MQPIQGITLLELLITISIMAILATLASPNFTTLLQNTRRMNAVNTVGHALLLARTEAIFRGETVSLCLSQDGNHCDPTQHDWAKGFMVFENLDGDEPAQLDPGETVIRVYAPSPQLHITSNRRTFSFRPALQGSVNGTITFCDARGSGEARAIIVNHTGRPRVAKRTSSNQALSCPN